MITISALWISAKYQVQMENFGVLVIADVLVALFWSGAIVGAFG